MTAAKIGRARMRLVTIRSILSACVAKKDADEKHRTKMRCFSYFNGGGGLLQEGTLPVGEAVKGAVLLSESSTELDIGIVTPGPSGAVAPEKRQVEHIHPIS